MTVRDLTSGRAPFFFCLLGMFLSLALSGCSSVYLTSYLSSKPTLSSNEKAVVSDRDRHFPLLAKGVNVQGWCVDGKTNILVKKKKFCVTENDIRLIQSMGFTHVRLLVEPKLLLDESRPDKVNPKSLQSLTALVRRFLSHRIAVVLDIHPWHVKDPVIKKRLATEEAFVGTFSTFWKTLAGHFQKIDSDRVFFEILNEPFFNEFLNDPVPRWRFVQSRLVSAIRSVAPHNTIIVGGHNWNSLEGVFEIAPVADANVVYSIHYYTPIEFTSQGSKWAGEGLKDLHHMPYPVDFFKLQKMMPAFPDISKARARHYQRSLFKSEKLYQDFLPVVQWANQRDLKLYVGEFGVFKKNTYPDDRARWLSDMRMMCERYGVAWSVWEYNQDFAITDESPSGRRLSDPVMLKAFGLMHN